MVEKALPSYLPLNDAAPQSALFDAMAYACAAGGKRLRPVLVLEFCRLCGGNPARALPFACAVEMVHSYSLVHDDLPCMDDSPLRRGRPSTHRQFGEALGLLAGDALLNRAFEVMLDAEYTGGLPPERALQAAFSLARGAGAFGMVGGQVLDLASEGQAVSLDRLETLQRGKTAALIRAACEMGCHAAGGTAAQLDAAARFGEYLGLGFQIVDDILDATASAEEMGKPTGCDSEHGKATYVTLLGLEEAGRLADRRTENALAALDPFGAAADDLRHLTGALRKRKL